jgi:hypothetical protein
MNRIAYTDLSKHVFQIRASDFKVEVSLEAKSVQLCLYGILGVVLKLLFQGKFEMTLH